MENNYSDGFIKLARKIQDNDLWTEKRIWNRNEAWIDMLLTARWKDEPAKKYFKNICITWGRGELVASNRFLQARWGWGAPKVIKFLTYLEEQKQIVTHKNQGMTVITICNYELYNGQPELENEETKRKRNASVTQTKRIRNADVTKQEEGKKEIKEELITVHPLQQWINENTPCVAKLEIQMTPKECDEILKHNPHLVKETLLAMENHKALNKNYKSVNLTLQNWIRRRNNDNGKQYSKSAKGAITEQQFTNTLAELYEFENGLKQPLETN